MPDPIELDSIDALGAGAVGEPGQRAFYIQARSESAQLTVLVEKEQVAPPLRAWITNVRSPG